MKTSKFKVLCGFLMVALAIYHYWTLSFDDDVQKNVFIQGRAEVHDGDSLRINDIRIRLYGIDAPELKQECENSDGKHYPCGIKAKDFLQGLSKFRVKCRQIEIDNYNRVVAICYSAKTDINQKMVEAGWAVAFTRYSNSYVAAENRAKKHRSGIWQGMFETPWEWRALHRTKSS